LGNIGKYSDVLETEGLKSMADKADTPVALNDKGKMEIGHLVVLERKVEEAGELCQANVLLVFDPENTSAPPKVEFANGLKLRDPQVRC
jgi:hypothetical protein